MEKQSFDHQTSITFDDIIDSFNWNRINLDNIEELKTSEIFKRHPKILQRFEQRNVNPANQGKKP